MQYIFVCLFAGFFLFYLKNDCIRYNASALGVTVKDTLKTVDENGSICGTIDREHTVRIQTPQVFYTAEIRELHERIKAEGVAVTDDCSVFEHYGKTVHVTVGRYENIKITTPEDMAAARDILRQRA